LYLLAVRLAGAQLLLVYRHGTDYRANIPVRDEGPWGGHDCGAALVLVEELLAVLGGFALVLDLGGHGRDSRAAHGCEFGGLRPYRDAAAASVVGDAIVGVVDDDGAVVDVGDAGYVDAVDGAVVVEVVTSPVASVISVADVTVAVVDAAVEADVEAPEAAVEAVAIAVVAPVAGGPEGSGVGGGAPGSGDPVVADGGVHPVAGGPDVVGCGGFGLHVDGQRGRGLFGLEGLLAGVYVVLVVGVVLVFGLGFGLGVGLVLLGLGWCSGLVSGLGVLLGSLLALVLPAGGKGAGGCGLGRYGGERLLRLAGVYGSQVGVGWIGAGVVGCDDSVGGLVAAGDCCHG